MNKELRLLLRRACIDSDAKLAEYEYRTAIVTVPFTEIMTNNTKYNGYEVIGGEWLNEEKP